MPRLIADCPLCGGPVYDIEGQKDCPSCKAELPEWFADVEPEYAPRYEDAESVAIQWIAEKGAQGTKCHRVNRSLTT